MRPLHHLLLCLLALALLPGPVAQARLATAMSPDEAVAAHVAAPAGGCHEAMGSRFADAGESAGVPLHAGHDEAPAPAHGCCDASASGDCGDTCPCPTALPALPLLAMAVPAVRRDSRWTASGLSSRHRFSEGPPSRPPIG